MADVQNGKNIPDEDEKNEDINGKPMDPSADFQQFIVDPSGLTGITDSQGTKNNPTSDQDNDTTGLVTPNFNTPTTNPPNPHQDGNTPSNTPKNHNVAAKAKNTIPLDELESGMNDTLKNATQAPHLFGEQSVSGDMPDPESDDDMLLNSHQVGLRLDEDEEHPKELNIAKDVALAEKHRREY